MSEHIGMYRDAYGNIKRNVCAQCKHFYMAIETRDITDAGPERICDEIRLCYEIHWCSAASPVCDDNFEPLTADEDSLEHRPVHHYYENECKFDCIPESKPKPQKEIQYVYIGLLQEDQDANGELIEVPTEIDGVATNYRRVEMGPMDWDLYYQERDGSTHSGIFTPNTATNAVDIEFPAAQADWNNIEYFGLYDSQVGGKLIMTDDFAEVDNMPAGNCASIDTGGLKIPLKHLTNIHEKKGGE